MTRLTTRELADLVPCPLDEVRRLQALGLVVPDASDGCFVPSDALVVRLMRAFEDAYISLDDVARGVASGDLVFPLGLFLPEPDATSATYEELADELGRPAALLRRLTSELGFPPADDDRLRPSDARVLSLLVTRLDLADEEELSRYARLYGGTMQRLVAAALEFFDRVVRARVASFDLPNEERDALVYAKAAGFTELASALVPWLQRRHREHAVLEYVVEVTEGFMDERGITSRQPREPPAIAFLDLTGYTSLAEERGDEAAAEAAASLASVVQAAARANGGRPVKWLGDGVMFHFGDPSRAVVGGLELLERTESAISLPARIGINAGAVVAQEGDYFGRTVNVAARITDYARPHEVLVSDEAKQSSRSPDVAFELVGDVPLKGVSRSVRLHRAVRT